jgi:hypothetical protein
MSCNGAWEGGGITGVHGGPFKDSFDMFILRGISNESLF